MSKLTKEDAEAVREALASLEYATSGVVSLSGTLGVRRYDSRGNNPTTVTVLVSWPEGEDPTFSTRPDFEAGTLLVLPDPDETALLAQAAAAFAAMDDAGRGRTLAYLADRFGLPAPSRTKENPDA